ncbi:hypothetical protein [Alkalibacillus aidingensis]|uniref:hypothetical protein n=1 Tax=Alkalibacillus aidingensis TaxID=2747607 RepID=UPI0016611F3F|nr:hypothetical protein [Alkalibacillus aidingensis]
MESEARLREIIKEELDHYMENQMAEMAKRFSTELINENGNSSVKQSGNGFVYVDNTGIAYALTLFFYQFMSEQYQQDIHLDQILTRLDQHVSENRKMFEDVINYFADESQHSQ